MLLKMKEVDPSEWAHIQEKDAIIGVTKVFRDDKFLVQVRQHGRTIRLTINKINHTIKNGRPIWEDGITWDEIQNIKNQCGFEDKWLCEYYPPKDEVQNVANMRHLWVLDEHPYDSLNYTYGIKTLCEDF